MQALIFDFDGLILDTETPDYQSWRLVYESYGANLPQSLWASLIGRSSAEAIFDVYGYLESQLNQPIDREAVRQQRYALLNDLIAQEVVLPGVTEYIADAKRLGMRVAVASSGTGKWVKGNLERLGLIEHFDVIKCKDDVKRGKPDPELYLAALAALDVTADAALALEDSPNGILAAKRAGILCVAVPNKMTQGLVFDQADFRVASLAEKPLEMLIRHVTANRSVP
jgi:HAD superfamily hydrolase (TIGR01509 family)